ncbi:MAG TPA: hypothetical protein VK148_16025 [Xanthobacteraceae bacterium]|jgi:hypothetical protein|nr:hypothetical protein [Xanthobacteraceae bacterium]
MLAIAPKNNLVRAFPGRAAVVIEPSMAAVDSIFIPKDSTIRVRQHGNFGPLSGKGLVWGGVITGILHRNKAGEE